MLAEWAIWKTIKGLITSPIFWVVIGILAATIWLQVHDKALIARAKAECVAEHVQAALEEKQRQADVLFQASQDAEKRAAANDMMVTNLKDEVERARADLGDARKHECRVPAAAGKRLQSIK